MVSDGRRGQPKPGTAARRKRRTVGCSQPGRPGVRRLRPQPPRGRDQTVPGTRGAQRQGQINDYLASVKLSIRSSLSRALLTPDHECLTMWRSWKEYTSAIWSLSPELETDSGVGVSRQPRSLNSDTTGAWLAINILFRQEWGGCCPMDRFGGSAWTKPLKSQLLTRPRVAPAIDVDPSTDRGKLCTWRRGAMADWPRLDLSSFSYGPASVVYETILLIRPELPPKANCGCSVSEQVQHNRPR